MLAIPLNKQQPNGDTSLLGLLRVDNKQDSNGRFNPALHFERQDEWVLTLFAQTAVVAIESAALLEALNEQKDHFQRILSSAPNCVIANFVNGDIFFFNEQAQALLGYQPEEIMGESVFKIYVDPNDARHIFHRLQTGKGSFTDYETVVLSKKGEHIPIRLSTTRLYDATGDVIGTVGYFEDLRTIRETQHRLEWLLNANRVVSQAQNLPEGLQKLAEIMVHLLNPALCFIMTMDEDNAGLITQAVWPDFSGDKAHALNLHEAEISLKTWPHLETFLHKMEPTWLETTSGWCGELMVVLPEALGYAETLTCLLLIPLKVGERVVGLLCLGDLAKSNSPNTIELMQLAVAIAEQTAVLIDRMLSHEMTRRHHHLLTTLDETSRHLRAELEIPQIWKEMLHLAVDLAGCSAGGVLINSPQLAEMVVTAVYNLPDGLVGTQIMHDDGLLGTVARQGTTQSTNEYSLWAEQDALFAEFDFETVVGLPLFQHGEVKAVLFVANTVRWHRVTQTDLDVLERFAAHAAITLRTSGLIGSEQRMYAQLAILHQISNTIQAADDLEKIMHVVLTGVTAGYGLGFNRAAVLLLDRGRQQLVGKMGIGHFLKSLAQADWRRDEKQGLYDFKAYLQQLERGELHLTPVGQQVRQLVLPVETAVPDPLSTVILEKQCLLVQPEQFDTLPHDFLAAFEPETPVVIAPLIVRDEAIGLFVADNKFNHFPISNGDMEHLLTFANAAAIAIDNTRLYNEARVAHKKLHHFYEGSTSLVSSQKLSDVVRDIVLQTQETSNASWVSLLLLNEQGRLETRDVAAINPNFQPHFTIRENGLSMQVLRTGQEIIIEDMQTWQNHVNASLFHNGVAAAACMPLSVRDKRLGVMWIHYNEKRPFPEPEREALRLFVNQVAIAYDAARRMEGLDRMRRAAEALAGASRLTDVRQQIVESARTVLFADRATIWSYDGKRRQYLLNESMPDDVDSAIWNAFRKKAPRPNGMADKVMKCGWVGIPDVADVTQSDVLSAETRLLLLQIGVQSFQCVALNVGDEKLGILYVNYPEPRPFDEEAKNTARTFATHAALSLKKARLLEGLRKARSTARILSSVTTLEGREATLTSVVEGTMDALQADAVVLFVYEEKSERLDFPPTMRGVKYPHLALNNANIMTNEFVVELLHRDEMYIADHVPEDSHFAERRFAVDEQVASCVAIPLRVGRIRVGIMFINYRTSHRFTGDD
ncbi:MAG: GAF domain-containing protein, partial [Chloroflexi bacterium]|nr:GAF domain-containing protein [Chloroflexota bacterium]